MQVDHDLTAAINALNYSPPASMFDVDDILVVPDIKRKPVHYAPGDYAAIIDKRNLDRECLAASLNSHNVGLKIITFSNLEEWEARKSVLGKLRVVLFNTGSVDVDEQEVRAEITELVYAFDPVPVVILSNNQDLSTVLKVVDLGVRGFIPTSVGIDVCIHALGLAVAGGTFIPASSILTMRWLFAGQTVEKPVTKTSFTARQAAVAEGLRRGKANRIIALELNLCESTVKVHIRNIMKKLGATNRTEVAYRIGDMSS
ncbi:response regulator transcription factor [Rhizobium sp. CFBP 8762]|uniref:response regulator transcription factor n=1 Tax=Rhizobium sp. CFBP 8762 TaxID=2775279 RepID=UPI001FCFBFFB|nr:response regulator transcription factor [Rhizobium sp. CFBP 8762]